MKRFANNFVSNIEKESHIKKKLREFTPHHNRIFASPRLEAELVDIYFRKPQEGESGIFMSVARALQLMSGNITQKLSPVFLGRAFGEQGFRRVKSGGQRGYIVVCRTADEIHQKQLSMAASAEDDRVDSGQ